MLCSEAAEGDSSHCENSWSPMTGSPMHANSVPCAWQRGKEKDSWLNHSLTISLSEQCLEIPRGKMHWKGVRLLFHFLVPASLCSRSPNTGGCWRSWLFKAAIIPGLGLVLNLITAEQIPVLFTETEERQGEKPQLG